MKSNKERLNVWLPLLLATMLAAGMIIGNTTKNIEAPYISSVDKKEGAYLFGQVEEILRLIETRYVDTVDRDVLITEAINSIVGKLDPHSIYIPPEHLTKVTEDMEGSFKGIGIEAKYINDTAIVTRIMEDGPAAASGMKQYDRILSINDSTAVDKRNSVHIIKNLISKSPTDEVKIDILRDDKEITLDITRDHIPVQSVDDAIILDSSLVYVSIKSFTSKTYKEFMTALEKVYDGKTPLDLIIDLRNNPGGYLPEATNILSQLFKKKDKLLVYTEDINNARQEFKSTGKQFYNIGKIAVLIDGGSASGSEIIAGSIQDWDRGVIIGQPSFGKGLVQQQYNLSSGGALRLTTERYYLPSGRSIQKHYTYGKNGDDKEQPSDTTTYRTKTLDRRMVNNSGIIPDIIIPKDSVYEDAYFKKAIDTAEEEILKIFAYEQNNMDTERIISSICDRMEQSGIDCNNRYSKELRQAMNAYIIRYKKGRRAAKIQLLQEDIAVKRAVTYITSDENLPQN